MRNEPQSRTMTLERKMQFSLGAGTMIASVNVKLSDIRERDYKGSGLSKRQWAVHVATELVHQKYAEAFGAPPNEDKGDPLQYLTVHTTDSVTCEIWQSGPETRRVNVKL